MNKRIKKLWVEALRSGEFEQGQRALRTKDNKCCCLGVLCELAYEADVIPHPVLTHATVFTYTYVNNAYAFTPEQVKRWAEINGSQESILASMNDRGCTFNQIADYIERNL